MGGGQVWVVEVAIIIDVTGKLSLTPPIPPFPLHGTFFFSSLYFRCTFFHIFTDLVSNDISFFVILIRSG